MRAEMRLACIDTRLMVVVWEVYSRIPLAASTPVSSTGALLAPEGAVRTMPQRERRSGAVAAVVVAARSPPAAWMRRSASAMGVSSSGGWWEGEMADGSTTSIIAMSSSMVKGDEGEKERKEERKTKGMKYKRKTRAHAPEVGRGNVTMESE